MTAAGDGTAVVLSGEEAAFLREVLADCSQALTRAQDQASPAVSALLAEAVQAAAAVSSPDGLIYQVNLAIDYLDFAEPARSRR
jgi:hypothetical protein